MNWPFAPLNPPPDPPEPYAPYDDEPPPPPATIKIDDLSFSSEDNTPDDVAIWVAPPPEAA